MSPQKIFQVVEELDIKKAANQARLPKILTNTNSPKFHSKSQVKTSRNANSKQLSKIDDLLNLKLEPL